MPLTPTQLAEHESALGGSDAPWYARLDFDLWRQKIGDAPPSHPTDMVRAEWGQRLEPAVRDWLAEQVGREIVPAPTLQHPKLPFLIGHVDGMFGGGPPREGAEIKTCDKLAAQEWGEVGTDQIPIPHVLQCTHYMAISDIRRFHVAVLIGGNDPRHYVLDYDPQLASMLIERAVVFWKHVVSRTPPTPTTLQHVDYLYPTSTETPLKANEAVAMAVHELARLRRAELAAGRQADELEITVKNFMASAAILTDARGHKLATWRQQDRTHFDSKAFAREHPDLHAQYRATSSFRVFRLS